MESAIWVIGTYCSRSEWHILLIMMIVIGCIHSIGGGVRGATSIRVLDPSVQGVVEVVAYG